MPQFKIDRIRASLVSSQVNLASDSFALEQLEGAFHPGIVVAASAPDLLALAVLLDTLPQLERHGV